MILHYTSISPNSRRVLTGAYQMGYELDLRHTNPDSPELLKLNPNGLVPVLEDGDFTLWESNAILQYLADKMVETSLFPKEPKARAEVARWQFWTLAHFDPVCGPFLWENEFKKQFTGGDPDLKAVERATAAFHPVARVLDQALSGRNFLVGEKPTLADFSVSSTLMYQETSRIPLGEHRNAMSWLNRMRELDSWKRSGKLIPGFSK